MTGILAKLALGPILSSVGKFLKGVPWQVWAGLALAFVAWRMVDYHRDTVSAADREGYQRAQGEWKAAEARYVAKALALKQSTEALTRNVNSILEKRYEKDAAADRALAGDLLLRGPGQAAARQCEPARKADPGTAGPAGASEDGPRPLDAGMATVPVPQGLATVPWSDLVGWAEVCDARGRALMLVQDAHSGWKQAWPKP